MAYTLQHRPLPTYSQQRQVGTMTTQCYLWLHRIQGDTLTSPLSLPLLTPQKQKGGGSQLLDRLKQRKFAFSREGEKCLYQYGAKTSPSSKGGFVVRGAMASILQGETANGNDLSC